MTGVFRLKGVVKHYDWGGEQYIPALLNTINTNHEPYAEYWMGVHPQGTALVEYNGDEVPLNEYVEDLPWLFKVLDVKNMLSIQVHPQKEEAAAGFDRENKAAVPQDAAHRNYRDRNHKPELMVALGDFWLLHGFKPPEQLVYTLLNVTELRELLPVFNEKGYEGLYRHVMEMPQHEVNRILTPLVDNLSTMYADGEPDKSDEDYWAARAAARFTRNGDIDRGIFSVYLFNLVNLKKGEGIFQAAGVPHAYLEGQNVEIMASSDNVLRGGLTSKHIDVAELLKQVKCEATWPVILQGENEGGHSRLFHTPVPDFCLFEIQLGAGETATFTPESIEIMLVVEGEAGISTPDGEISIQKGHPAAVAFPGLPVSVQSAGGALIYRASVPLNGY